MPVKKNTLIVSTVEVVDEFCSYLRMQLWKGRESTYRKSVSYIRQDEEGLEE